MVVVLPNQRHGVQQLVRDIRTSINSIAEKLNETEVLVALPRFKIDPIIKHYNILFRSDITTQIKVCSTLCQAIDEVN